MLWHAVYLAGTRNNNSR